jgi:hypothetical protein
MGIPASMHREKRMTGHWAMVFICWHVSVYFFIREYSERTYLKSMDAFYFLLQCLCD